MEVDSSFRVNAPIDEVWKTVMDVERVATAVPGAELTEKLSDTSYQGVVKVKVGPLAMQYRGHLELVSRDDVAHVAVFKGKAQEKAGQGTADGTVTVSLTETEGETTGSVHSDIALSGKAAAMGKGVITTVTQQIMKIFAGNLQAMLAGEEDAGTGESADGSVKGMTLVAGAVGSIFRRGDKDRGDKGRAQKDGAEEGRAEKDGEKEADEDRGATDKETTKG